MIFTCLLHGIYSTIVAFLLSLIFGALSPAIALVSLIIGTCLAYWHSREFLASDSRLRFRSLSPGLAGVMEFGILIFILFAAYRHFMWLLFPADFFWKTLSPNNLGDLPLHINYIRSLAQGISFPPHNPIFSSELLRYPYGVDLYSALWEALGFRLQAHLFIVGLFATAASLTLLKRFGSWWAMGAFFLSGGLAGWSVLTGAPLENFQAAVDWKNLFLAVFITQRGMLFTLPLGLWLLVTVRAYFQGDTSLSRRQWTALGLGWGFLPLFHLHAFAIVSALLLFTVFECRGLAGLLSLIKSQLTLIAVLPATLLILFSTNFFQAAGVSHLSWGWTFNHGATNLLSVTALVFSFFNFLFFNFGPWLFLPFILAVSIFYSKNGMIPEKRRKLFFELGVYTVLFATFMNLMLAPWAWDNIKILIWPYLGFARISWLVFEPLFKTKLELLERGVVAVLLFLSGTVSILFSMQSPAQQSVSIFSFSELANVEGALSGIEPNAVFVAAPSFAHPLAYYGRLRVLGYAGHLFSYGIDSREVEAKLKRIMDGDLDSLRLAKELKANYIFWGPEERTMYGDHVRSWMKELANVSRVPGYEVYAVK